MDTPTDNDFYTIGGMNQDVNPYDMKDGECNLILNFYTHKALAKKVRFGYTAFLNNPDNSPVRNLYFYSFPNSNSPNSVGLLRVSNKNIYKSTSMTGSWGSPIGTFSNDVNQSFCQISGISNYVIYSNAPYGVYKYDGTNATLAGGSFLPRATFVMSYQSRVFTDVNRLSLAESWIGFDSNVPSYSPYNSDPFSYSTTGILSQGGLTPLDSGNNGAIVGMSVVQNNLIIYKQTGVYRYDGSNIVLLNFAGSVIPYTICTSDYFRINYFLSSDGIYSCDAQTVQPISFGVNNIIQDSYLHNTISNPLSFCFQYLSFFWLGSIWYNGTTINNAMIVRDERIGENYIWSIGHTITAFGSFVDSNNRRHMVTGDNLGNTYIWGEEYFNDNGLPINFDLRMKYIDNGKPSSKKTPQPQLGVSADPSNEAKIYIARDYNDIYTQIGSCNGKFAKFNYQSANYPNYYAISIRIAGTTVNGDRPEIYGYSVNYDEEEIFSDGKSYSQSKK
jgi:hypothetical protein